LILHKKCSRVTHFLSASLKYSSMENEYIEDQIIKAYFSYSACFYEETLKNMRSILQVIFLQEQFAIFSLPLFSAAKTFMWYKSSTVP